MLCHDPGFCDVTVDASGAQLTLEDELGAPARPAAGAYSPKWIYGARWPFCAAPTTLVLSNLPDSILQEDLIEILDKEGFSSFYDFVYLPVDADSGRNMGYAIVNLTRHQYGLSLAAIMQG